MPLPLDWAAIDSERHAKNKNVENNFFITDTENMVLNREHSDPLKL